MSQQHVEDQKALPRVILAAIFAYFGPRFCLGCATSALLTVINKLVEIAIQKGDDELLRNISRAFIGSRPQPERSSRYAIRKWSLAFPRG